MTDVVIQVIIALLTVAITVLGAGVFSDKRWHKTVILITGFFCVFLMSWQGYRTYRLRYLCPNDLNQLRRWWSP